MLADCLKVPREHFLVSLDASRHTWGRRLLLHFNFTFSLIPSLHQNLLQSDRS